MATLYSNAASPNPKTIDSLQRVVGSAVPDSIRADALFRLAIQYWDEQPDIAINYAAQTYYLSERIGYKRGVADACRAYSGAYGVRKDYYQAIKYKRLELRYRRDAGDSVGVANCFYSMGDKYGAIGDVNASLKNYSDALSLYEQLGDEHNVAGLLNNIGLIYAKLGNDVEAVQYYYKALHINEKIGNNQWRVINLGNLAQYYLRTGQIDEAMKICRQGVEANAKLEVQHVQIIGGLASAYIAKSYYDSAESSLRTALRVARTNGDSSSFSWLYSILAGSYRLQRKFSMAKKCLDTCIVLDKLLGSDPEAMRNTYEELYKLDSARGDGIGALRNYMMYVTMRDSLIHGGTALLATQQQLRSEFEKRESEATAEQNERVAAQVRTRNILLSSLVLVALVAAVIYYQYRLKHKANELVTREKERSESLLLNILPAEVASELKEKGHADAKHFDNVTVLFTDFKSFTTFSEQLSPQELVNELHACFKAFDEICERYGIEKIKTIGDAYLAVCGLPLANERHAENVVRAAIEIRDFMLERRRTHGPSTFECRIGINSGSVVAGIVGVKKYSYDIWGDTVNTAARIEQNGEVGKINISETTRELVDALFSLEYRGEIDAKNKGKLKMYFVA